MVATGAYSGCIAMNEFVAKRSNCAMSPPMLTYHEIGKVRAHGAYSISRSQFEEHLMMAAKVERTDSRPCGSIQFTFDDGHVSNYEHAGPCLEDYGRRGIFFVVSSFIGVRSDFMTWEQVRELSELGHFIQSHTWSHPLLTHCDDRELDYELVRSRSEIEDQLGKPVKALGIPGGRWDRRVLNAAARAGYEQVFVSNPFVKPQNIHNVDLCGRLTVKHSMSSKLLMSLLRGRGPHKLGFSARYAAKEIFRMVVGDGMYGRLWSALENSAPPDSD